MVELVHRACLSIYSAGRSAQCALEVEADLVECAPNTPGVIPALVIVFLIQCAIVCCVISVLALSAPATDNHNCLSLSFLMGAVLSM